MKYFTLQEFRLHRDTHITIFPPPGAGVQIEKLSLISHIHPFAHTIAHTFKHPHVCTHTNSLYTKLEYSLINDFIPL